MKTGPMNTSQSSELIEALQSSKAIAQIAEKVQEEIQQYLEEKLIECQQTISATNLAYIDIVHQELAKVKEESLTLQGVLDRLKTATAPELAKVPDEEIVSFRQAIDNLEKYGSIIPSSTDIAIVQIAAQKQRNWSLFKQVLLRFLIHKLEAILGIRSIS